ncbi:metal ABC transporter substrate-binding protein [Engelhardtia mirabilis]|uniref:High-affinity zinc uptake system binding-protein ZnuA n=1 Tax=Engelhardtia mirabilis TaxID=2528011 RepID=A0A518BKT8_9BACT|nr:High-affinity zinc uptake system binding-protein ZnuA precursor [Planctomycetes bacterium Pla133]QDV01917.1 High-affinity zinc uptake system binding-protein ZnuA precursor [Planctomycetes bacterium Pla86]
MALTRSIRSSRNSVPALFAAPLALALGGLLSACGGAGGTGTAEAIEPDQVVRTTAYPVHFLTERVAGPEIEVELVLPAGADPIFWQPPREVLAALQGSRLIVTNGADFERWMRSASLPSTRVVRSADGFADRHLQFEGATHSHGPTGEHSHTGTDGHTWMDPRNAEDQALAIAAALADAYPDQAEQIQGRMVALRADLRALDRRLTQMLPALAQVRLIASHPAYDYIAARYGLEIVNLDLDPAEPLGLADFASIEAATDAGRVNVLLWESEPLAETVTELDERLGVRSVVFSPAEGPPAAGEPDYLGVMNANLDRLGEAAGVTSEGE